MSNPVRVFISYSWDSSDHKQRVLDFAQRLRRDGVDAQLDRFTTFPPEGWPRWMESELETAMFVVVIATEKYAQRFAGKAPTGTGLGATWEGAIITQDLYESGARNIKFLPAIFSEPEAAFVPKPLRASTRFRLDTKTGYENLYRYITGQPDVTPHPIGSQRKLGKMAPPTYSALPAAAVHDHVSARSNLPRLPYGFFGRDDELKKILDSLASTARTWGALIDGAGGIGKTALAVRAAELTQPGQFQRIIFLSAKSHELTPAGTRALTNFVVPAYLDMLTELARYIDHPELARADEKHRARLLQEALQGQQVLAIFDNLESLQNEDRNSLFDFLSRLPGGCKAIVTSRRRSDIDARIVRVERLTKDAALSLIGKLAEDRPLLAKTSEADRIALYTGAGGNPLLIRWVAGQLGRTGCRDISTALQMLRNAPPDGDPLEFVFGDLANTFTNEETAVLAALTYFSSPVEVKYVADVANLREAATQTALEDLSDRSLVTADAESARFALLPLVRTFLRRARPEAVRCAADRLIDRTSSLVEKHSKDEDKGYSTFEASSAMITAALPVLMQGKELYDNLFQKLASFLRHSGRWDEMLALSSQAEANCVAANAWEDAGWHAYRAATVYEARKDIAALVACAKRAAEYWKKANVGPREEAIVLQLSAAGHLLAGDSTAAIKELEKVLVLDRGLSATSRDVAVDLNALSEARLRAGDLDGARRDLEEAIEIAKSLGEPTGIAIYLGNLAAMCLSEENWEKAEEAAREALKLSQQLGSRVTIATNYARLAVAAMHQGRIPDALMYAHESLPILAELKHALEEPVREIIRGCEAKAATNA
jgi:tetratricopeptide (TPR) repeat protein